MGEHKLSSPGSRQKRETIKIFSRNRTTINRIESRLLREFSSRAKNLGTEVLRGTHGNIPTKAEAIDILIVAWNCIQEAERTRIFNEYIRQLLPEPQISAEQTEEARNDS